jgi:hypothetical protein
MPQNKKEKRIAAAKSVKTLEKLEKLPEFQEAHYQNLIAYKKQSFRNHHLMRSHGGTRRRRGTRHTRALTARRRV